MQSDNKATTKKVTRNREVIPVFKVVESDEMSSNLTFSEHFLQSQDADTPVGDRYPQLSPRYFEVFSNLSLSPS